MLPFDTVTLYLYFSIVKLLLIVGKHCYDKCYLRTNMLSRLKTHVPFIMEERNKQLGKD